MSASKFNQPFVTLPLMSNAMPNVIAEEICKVQQMPVDVINPFNKKWEKVGMDMMTDKWVYNICAKEIRDWIETHPIHMWKYYDLPSNMSETDLKNVPIRALLGKNYIFTEEMEAWFQLRWS